MSEEIKNSFVGYGSWKEHLKYFSAEEKGLIFDAILDYADSRIEPDFASVACTIAFSFIKEQIDNNNKKYEDDKKNKSEAGKKGMASRWGKKNESSRDSDDLEANNTVTDVITKDNKDNTTTDVITGDTGVITDITYRIKDKDTGERIRMQEKDIPPKSPKGDYESKNLQESRFEEFWRLYPNKKAKQEAKKSWLKLKPDSNLHKKIINAIIASSNSYEWTKYNGEYIPHPSNWLNQGRWDDEVTPLTAKGGNNHGHDLGHNQTKNGGDKPKYGDLII